MFNQPQRAPSANAFVTRIAGRKSVETYAESQQPLCPTNLTLLETILHYPVTVKKMFDIPNTDMCSFVSQEWPKTKVTNTFLEMRLKKEEKGNPGHARDN
jgi:hypothetical protein